MAHPNNIERAMRQVEPDLNSGCWLWAGALSNSGYGRTSLRRKDVLAHRFFYENLKGPIPPGKWALHKCDTRSCVNPDHITLGTPRENTQEAIQRGRWRPPTGEAHGNAKLTAQDVRAIRAAPGRTSRKALAEQFGVSTGTIGDVLRGRGWRSVAP